MSVTFQKLAVRLHAGLENNPSFPQLTQHQIFHLLNQTFDEIGDALTHGEDVYLEGFGRFYPDCKPARKVKSGLTAETHITEPKVFVRFNAFKALKYRVQAFLRSIGIDGEYADDDDDDDHKETPYV